MTPILVFTIWIYTFATVFCAAAAWNKMLERERQRRALGGER